MKIIICYNGYQVIEIHDKLSLKQVFENAFRIECLSKFCYLYKDEMVVSSNTDVNQLKNGEIIKFWNHNEKY